MKDIKNSSLTRRALFFLATNGVTAALVPRHVHASQIDTLDELTFNYNESIAMEEIRCDLSQNQIKNLIEKQIENEVSHILEKAQQNDGNLPLRLRPRYETKTGKTRYASTGYRKAQGIPAGGINMRNGGTINIAPDGGSSISVTVAFGTPFGSMGVSLPLSKRVTSPTATSFSVNIPADKHYYTVSVNTKYAIAPYIVYYYDAKGKKHVYYRGCTHPIYYSHSFENVRIS